MKSKLLLLNTRYYQDCYTENADKTQFDGPWLANFIIIIIYFREECDYEMYQRYISKLTNISEMKNESDLADLPQGPN